jgi:hypothetical protein
VTTFNLNNKIRVKLTDAGRHANMAAMAKVFFIMSVPFSPIAQTFERFHLLCRTSN